MLYELTVMVEVPDNRRASDLLSGMVDVAGDEFVAASGRQVEEAEEVDVEDATT